MREITKTGTRQLDLAALCKRGEQLAASPEAIEAYERNIRDATTRETRERYSRAAAKVRRIVPLRPEIHDVIAAHCDPLREGASPLKRTRALSAVGQWREDERRTVIALLGTVGTGKTTSAALAALRALQQRQSVVYVKEPTLLRWRKFIRHQDDLAAMLRADLLIVDELGTCLPKDAEDARMSILEIVDDRLSVGRTMLLGNLDRASFGQRYDARLVDRLAEVGLIVDVSGPSLRSAAA